MIIREVIISNYQCYYDEKKFDFTKGSNIILGKNGGGKTKFFEALEWLFTGSKLTLDELISKKKLSEAQNGETFKVGVEITFDQNGYLSTVKRYFTVQKNEGKEFTTSNAVYEGFMENEKGERDFMDGKILLDDIFPPTNRKYSFFKGETELDVLKNTDALDNLIGLYANVKHYKPYADKGANLKAYADKEIESAVKKDKKNADRYRWLEIEIKEIQKKINDKEMFLSVKDKEFRKLEENMQGVEKHLDNAEALETIKKRINNLEDDIRRAENRIDENYTTALFDKNWFLLGFEKIQAEFSEKIKDLSDRRRKLQRDFDREQGKKEGEKQLKAELLKNVTPLPADTPSRAVMEEMIKDKICKVCGTDAPEGSKPYNFMMERLNEYVKTLQPAEEDEEEKEELFKFNYTTKLVNLEASLDNNLAKVRGIEQEIKDRVEWNKSTKQQIENFQEKRDKELTDFENILGMAGVNQDTLTNNIKNYRGWQKDSIAIAKEVQTLNEDLVKLREQLQEKNAEKDDIDINTASNYLTKTRQVLRDIEKIFVETKEKKYDEFVARLEKLSNEFLKKINAGSFTGYIDIKRKNVNGNENVYVSLMQDGEIFYNPNTSLQTSMHLAILFAIAQLTKEEKEEYFPIIFDAPTSSFDPVKRKNFFDVLGECSEQSILLTKDFTDNSGQKGGLLYSEDFVDIKRDKAYLIKLEEPFDDEVLSTINTQVIPI